jgi:hypothetical protein
VGFPGNLFGCGLRGPQHTLHIFEPADQQFVLVVEMGVESGTPHIGPIEDLLDGDGFIFLFENLSTTRAWVIWWPKERKEKLCNPNVRRQLQRMDKLSQAAGNGVLGTISSFASTTVMVSVRHSNFRHEMRVWRSHP